MPLRKLQCVTEVKDWDFSSLNFHLQLLEQLFLDLNVLSSFMYVDQHLVMLTSKKKKKMNLLFCSHKSYELLQECPDCCLAKGNITFPPEITQNTQDESAGI